MPRPPAHVGGTVPAHRTTAAFAVYSEAEQLALHHLERITEQADIDHVIGKLKLGLDEGEQVRATLLRKGQQIPGRGVWLIPADCTCKGCTGGDG